MSANKPEGSNKPRRSSCSISSGSNCERTCSASDAKEGKGRAEHMPACIWGWGGSGTTQEVPTIDLMTSTSSVSMGTRREGGFGGGGSSVDVCELEEKSQSSASSQALW